MRRFFRAVIILTVVLPLLATAGVGGERALPTIAGKEAVATVNGEPISREELGQAVGMRHAEVAEGKRAGKVDYSEILNRLVNTRLILLEARNMGLDGLPEVRSEVDNYARNTLAEVLLERQTRDIAVADNDVDARYGEMVKEYKLQSLLFTKEEDAKRFEAEIGSGQDFGKAVAKALDERAAKGREEGAYIRSEHLLPEIKEAVSRMEVGSVSPVIKIRSGYTILKLEEIRFPENPEARDQAREMLLGVRKVEKTREYLESLKKEYVRVKQDVLDGLDYDASADGFRALLEDRRAVAEVKGEDPVTVGELSEAIQKKFFHGIESAVEKKAVNAKKSDVLETFLNRRVVAKEALRLGIDKTETYRGMVKDYENSVLFGVFLQKVIRPEIRLDDKELRAYYDRHLAEFSTPGMMRIDGLVFSRKARAKEAMHKLKEGAEFSWVAANADGQVDGNSEDVLRFDGKPVAVTSLPKDVQDVVTGASAGDVRLYESPEGYAYVLSMKDVVPARPRPYEQAVGEIAQKVTAEKLKRGVEEYAGSLRKAYPVKVFLGEPIP